jgi:RHS repeat-associated protein
LELREVTLDEANPSSEYVVAPPSMNVLIADGGSRLARVIFSGAPTLPTGVPRQQVLLSFTDHLGSTSSLIERSTGELVEALTYQAFGATNDDYRPARWAAFREAYRFTGKEEDVQLGITYFGKRYYAPHLGVWLSPDPVTIHDLGSDSNPYAYVLGRPIVAVDRRGEEPLFAAIGVAIVTGMVTEYTRQVITDPNHIHLEEVLIAGVVSGMGAGAGYLVGGGVGRLVFNQTASVGWAQFSTAVFGGAASGVVSGITDNILHANKQWDDWDVLLLDAAKGSLAATVTFGATKGLGLVYNNHKPTWAPTLETTTGDVGLDGANWESAQIQREEIASGWGHEVHPLGLPGQWKTNHQQWYVHSPDVPELKATFRLDLPTAGGAVLSGLVGEGIYQGSKELGFAVGPSQREKHPQGFYWDVPWYGPAFIGLGWPLGFSDSLRDNVFLDGSRFHSPDESKSENVGEISQ